MQGLIFTLYDTLAYFVPGIVVSLTLFILVNQSGLDTGLSALGLPETVLTVIALAVSYMMGHLLHAVANLTIDKLPSGGYPPGNYFPDEFREDFQEPFRSVLYEHIVESFHLKDTAEPDPTVPNRDKQVDDTVKSAYWPCYLAVTQSKANSLPQIFNALCSLYRGLCIGSFAIALVYLVSAFALANLVLLWVVLVALGIGSLLLKRISRFKRYLAKTVYSDFLFATSASAEDQKKKE